MDLQQPRPASPGLPASPLFADDWSMPSSPRATEANWNPPPSTTAPSPSLTEECRAPSASTLSSDYDAPVEEGIQLANAMFHNRGRVLLCYDNSRTGGFLVQPGPLDLYDTRPLEQEAGEDLESYYLRFKGALLQSKRHGTLCRSPEVIGKFILGLYDSRVLSRAITRAHRAPESASLDEAYRRIRAAETELRSGAYRRQQTYSWPQQPTHRDRDPETAAVWDTHLPTNQYSPGGLGQPWPAREEPRYRRRELYPDYFG